MQPILSPSKVSVHLSSWDISRDFHFHSNLLIYIAANNWQDYIKSFSIHGWRKILFSWPKRDIIFLLSSWDIAILFDRLHRFELGAIRFPRIFFNSNTWYWDENKAKLTNFIELAILEFWCPKRTHNTKSTLLPLEPLLQHCNKTTYGKRQILKFCIPWNDEKVGKFIARHCSSYPREAEFTFWTMSARWESLTLGIVLGLVPKFRTQVCPAIPTVVSIPKVPIFRKIDGKLHSYFVVFFIDIVTSIRPVRGHSIKKNHKN